MSIFFLSRSIAWPLNIFGTNPKTSSTTASENEEIASNLSTNTSTKSVDQLKNDFDSKINFDEKNFSQLPSASALSALGKHYLTKEDLEKLIRTRFADETPRDRVERLLWKDEFGNYPNFATIKDYQCSIIAMGVGVVYGYNRKEEMKPVYIRQTSMAKFQDRLTAERAFRQFNVVMFMKESYRVSLLVLFITETIMTTQYAIEAYRNKSTIYDAIPGGALVGFAFKALHSPLGALVSTVQGAILGFFYGFFHNIGNRLIDRTYEDIHYEQVMNWILHRENAELWSANLDEVSPSYTSSANEQTWGLGWFKS